MALIIIDMQTAYPASSRATKQVVQEIRKARRNKEHIINVTLGNTDVVKPVQDALYNYKRFAKVAKYMNGGGYEIEKLLQTKNWKRFRRFKVCGVNTNACVRDTVSQMSRLEIFKDIHVLANACADGNADVSHQDGLNHMKKLKKVTIVNT